MLLFIKIILLLGLLYITYQDVKERNVSLWLLIMVLLLMGYLHIQNSTTVLFLANSFVNMGIVFLIVVTLYLYTTFKLKQAFLTAFGLGDLLFFITIAIAFPTLTFIVLFTFSLFFTALIYFLFSKKLNHQTVPLAGLQSLYFSLIFLLNWSLTLFNFYQ